MRIFLETMEVFGLTLAILDFWNLSDKIEKFLDKIRNKLRTIIPKDFWSILAGCLKFSFFIFIMFFLGAILGLVLGNYNSLYHAVSTAIQPSIIIALYLITAFGFIPALYWTMHLLNLAKSGTVGSIGLGVSLICFLGGKFF